MGRQAGSVDQGSCQQAQGPEFNPYDSPSLKKAHTPTRFFDSHTYLHTNTHTNIIFKKFIEEIIKEITNVKSHFKSIAVIATLNIKDVSYGHFSLPFNLS